MAQQQIDPSKFDVNHFLTEKAYRCIDASLNPEGNTERDRLAGKIKYRFIMMALAEIQDQVPDKDAWEPLLPEEVKLHLRRKIKARNN